MTQEIEQSKDQRAINVQMAPGQERVEVVLRHGEAPKLLENVAPIKQNLSGVIGTVVEYLQKRLPTGQFTEENSHIVINRENISITLSINESDEYHRGQIVGTLDLHPAFVKFGINSSKVWTPTELGLFFKMNRVFFADIKANMSIVSLIMNFTASVNTQIERSAKENGDRTDNFKQLVDSNLPKSFVLNIPIFKGMPAETLEVETFAQINGREVSFVLLSPAANQTLEDIRDKVIDEQLQQIRTIAPLIALIEE